MSRPSFAKIVGAVSDFYEIKKKALLGPRRQKELVKARQVAMYFLRETLNKSYPKIGRFFGNRDHTTAIHSYNKIKSDIKNNPRLRRELEQISNIINKDELKMLLPETVVSFVQQPEKEVNKWWEKTIENLRKEAPSLVATEREKSMLEEWRSGKTLEKIGTEWKITRERVRQIITKAILREIANKVNEGFEIDVQEYFRYEKNQRNNQKEKKLHVSNPEIKTSEEPKRWSRFYARCRQCGTTLIPHIRRGLCQKCYGIVINREEIISKEGKRCENCGISRTLAFARFGRDLYLLQVDNDDANPNYMVLCKSCFSRIRGKTLGHRKR